MVRGLKLAAAALIATAGASACGGAGAEGAGSRSNAHPVAASATSSPAPAATPSATPPGVGADWAQRLAGHDQVVVARGDSATATHVTLTAYQRSATGWQAGPSWSGYNGRNGWVVNPISGHHDSPIGVFTLTGAGGYSASPGTRLPYDHDAATFARVINGVEAFNHVIAIDYNHTPGSSPNDRRRPLTSKAAHGIWIHVAHKSPSLGCLGIPDEGVVYLLRWLDPAAHPVVAMAPEQVLRL